MKKLGELLDMQKAGALKVDLDAGTMAGVKGTKEQFDNVTKLLGWKEKYLSDLKLINKTDKLLKGLQKLAPGYFRENATLEMYNMRKADSIDSFDRIVISDGHTTLTLLYNMKDVGGKYVLYDKSVHVSQPVVKAAHLKCIVEYLNKNYA